MAGAHCDSNTVIVNLGDLWARSPRAGGPGRYQGGLVGPPGPQLEPGREQRAAQVGPAQVGTTQVGPEEVGLREVDSAEVGTEEQRPTQVGAGELLVAQVA